MKEYEFALRFAVPSIEAISDELVDQLCDAGCDDALIGVGHAGRIAMEFARTSDSAHEAILSAIRDVREVLPDAELIEVTPDIVGLTDVAEMVGCSRQNMRKLLVACGARGPAPIHEGTSTLWHLAPVLNWLVHDKRYSIPGDLLELSEATMKVNLALNALGTDNETRDEIHALCAKAPVAMCTRNEGGR
jgi:hypothetical protein